MILLDQTVKSFVYLRSSATKTGTALMQNKLKSHCVYSVAYIKRQKFLPYIKAVGGEPQVIMVWQCNAAVSTCEIYPNISKVENN